MSGNMFQHPDHVLVIQRYDLLDPLSRIGFVAAMEPVVRAHGNRPFASPYAIDPGQRVWDHNPQTDLNVEETIRNSAAAVGVLALYRRFSRPAEHTYEPCGYGILTVPSSVIGTPPVVLHALRVSPKYRGHNVGAVVGDTTLETLPAVTTLLDNGRIDGLPRYDARPSLGPVGDERQAWTVREARAYLAQQFPDAMPPTRMNILYST